MYIILHLDYLPRNWKYRIKFNVIEYIFTMWPHWPFPRTWTPDPWTMNFTTLAEGLMGIILRHLVFFSNVNGGSEEDLIHVLSMAILATPSGPNTWPRDHFTVYIKGWMASITLLLVFLKCIWDRRRRFFKDLIYRHYMADFRFLSVSGPKGKNPVTTRSPKRYIYTWTVKICGKELDQSYVYM